MAAPVDNQAVGAAEPEDAAARSNELPDYVWQILLTPTYKDLKEGDKVVCTGGWCYDQLRNIRLEFVAHVWNFRVGKQYLRCWVPRGPLTGWIHLQVDHVKKV